MKLLVIDTQKGITDNRLFAFSEFVSNVKSLIKTARQEGVEVIFVQHDDGPGTGFSIGDEEFEIYDEFKPTRNERVFIKTVNSALHPSSGLLSYLNEHKEKQLIIVGLQTNYCIDATIKTAFDHGFDIYIPSHCNSTFDNPYMNAKATYEYYNEMIWPDRFAKCISVDDAISLLKTNYIKKITPSSSRRG